MPLSTEWPISAQPLPPRSLQREPRTQGTLLSARLRDRTGQGRNIDGQAGSCVARVGTGEGSQPRRSRPGRERLSLIAQAGCRPSRAFEQIALLGRRLAALRLHHGRPRTRLAGPVAPSFLPKSLDVVLPGRLSASAHPLTSASRQPMGLGLMERSADVQKAFAGNANGHG